MHRSRRQWLARSTALGGAAALWQWNALAESAYPSRPLRLVVPYPVGGGTDTVARLIGQRLSQSWGQPVVVDNRPGASGMVGNEIVAKVTPDGYTILMAITAMIQSPSLYKKIPYNVERDFTPVSLAVRSSDLLVVPKRVPARTITDLVALAKASPGKLSYGSYGNGTSSHLHGEQLKLRANIDLVHIPYKGAAPLMSDVLGGHVDAAFVDVSSAYSYLDSGTIRILGITGTQRHKALPSVPTFAEAGLPGFEPNGWMAFFLPPRATHAITAKLSAELARIVRLPDVSQRLMGMGLQPVGSTPEELSTVVRTDTPKWASIVRNAQIQLD